MKQYDIILIYFFVRDNLYYLNIIKTLSPKYKIGLLLSNDKNFYNKPENSTFKKLKTTGEKFRSLCVEYGADKIYVDEQLQCKLCLMPLFDGYAPDYLQTLKKNVKCDKLIGLFNFGRSTKGLNILKQWNASKYFVPCKDLLEKNATKDGTLNQLEGLEIVEAGFPYKQYPVFKELNDKIDYLVAFPSPIRLKSGQHQEKYEAFKVLLTYLNELTKDNKVLIKYHNVKDAHRFYSQKIKSPVIIKKLIIKLSPMLAKVIPFKRVQDKFYSISSQLLYSFIVDNYPSLEDLTEYSNLGIEIFMPHIKKGVITGLSATVVHALYNKIPVYNFDSQIMKGDIAPIYDIIQLPCNKHALMFDTNYYKRINNNVRNADMITLIEKEL